jgi:hypothetical protein
MQKFIQFIQNFCETDFGYETVFILNATACRQYHAKDLGSLLESYTTLDLS